MGKLAMKESTLNQVIHIIKHASGMDETDSINANTPLTGSGLSLDSVAVLEILLELEKEFHIEIDANELLNTEALQNAKTLSAFIESKMK